MYKSLHVLFQCVKAAIMSIKANGLRSLLTTIGIVIGVAAVISVISIMNGLSATIGNQLDDFATDMVTIQAKTHDMQKRLSSSNSLNFENYVWLKNKADYLEDLSPVTQPTGPKTSVHFAGRSHPTRVIGTDSVYQNVVKVYPERGRFLSETDDKRRRRVVFLGKSVLKNLDIKNDPIGKFIRLGDDWLRVIGVGEARGSLFGFDQDDYMIIPINTLRSIYGEGVTDSINILFRPKKSVHMDIAIAQSSELLRTSLKLKKNEADTFEFITAKKMQKQFDTIVKAVLAVTGGVVGMSLLVGGIGVMNIMLVSVTERTREIGIVKSLGASPQFIMLQFLFESLFLSLMGCAVGLLFGFGIAGFSALILPSPPDTLVPGWAIVLSVGFTTSIGVLFGLAPAIKASRLDPIDALRYG